MQKQNILNVCLLNTLKYNSGNITILVLLYMIMIKHLFNECVCKPLQPYLMYRQAKKKKSPFYWFTFISLPTFPPTCIDMFGPSLSKGCFIVGCSILF